MTQYHIGDTYVVRLQKGEDILSSVKMLCEQEHIALGTISALGAVNHVVIGAYEVEKQQYVSRAFDGTMEMTSLTGNITEMNGGPYLHVHATFGNLNGTVIGGHLNEAVVSATCEFFIRRLDGRIGRRLDRETGLNILDI
ncbi:PPC domain-containing DNA-binding protein [Clostridium sp. D33t1_170424_F3]|uniref:PPC domain-containing DNA-binding protein n=1 Tax=Clostridium sp. D33t1_170424_F3 TaxID=2787099 RepID=UPI0018A92C50|nr:PPC domain-containing DNA-binding protein [Clostridium sp. D33t1_170424_F3]